MTFPEEFSRLLQIFGWDAQRFLEFDGEVWKNHQLPDEKSSYTIAQLDELQWGQHGWWNRTRNLVVLDLVSRFAPSGPIWEIGSGSGTVASFLNGQGVEVVAVEPGLGGAERSSRLGVISVRSTLGALELPTSSLHAIGMFDVLEHLPDRPAMLREIKRVLAPGGHLILTLPALRMLWSGSDEAAGHYLRYSKRTIRRELADAGFTVERARYFFVLTVLPLLILRAIPHRLGRGPVVADEDLAAKDAGRIGRIASWCERMWARVGLTGSSLLVVARAN